MQETRHAPGRPRRQGTGAAAAVLAFAAVALLVGVLAYRESWRRRTQMQTDPRVARIWVAGTTFGVEHTLQHGSKLQGWLNDHHISWFGDYKRYIGSYMGEPGSVELWFDYESYLVGHPELECHRIDPTGTAFTDDLGQPYHGFLDIHGKTIGVYMPGYDHAARHLRCVLHWLPRSPSPPYPVSRPMVFTIDLPPARRILPASAAVPRGPIHVAGDGISVTAWGARLGPPKLASIAGGQRNLTFHMKIEGGQIANDNVFDESSDDTLTGDDAAFASAGRGARLTLPRAAVRVLPPTLRLRARSGPVLNTLVFPRLRIGSAHESGPLVITDPYGTPLLAQDQSVTPLVSKDNREQTRRGAGAIWVAAVNGAGRGTDAIQLQIAVEQGRAGKTGKRAVVPFTLILPVQTGVAN